MSFEARINNSEDEKRGVAAQGFEGRRRVLVLDVQPTVDAGRYPIKRIRGDVLEVTCDLVCDGHDSLGGLVRVLAPDATDWFEVPLSFLENDRWIADFELTSIGAWTFSVESWVDEFASWQSGTLRKRSAGQDVHIELQAGQQLVAEARDRAPAEQRGSLESWYTACTTGPLPGRLDAILSDGLLKLMQGNPDRRFSTRSAQFQMTADPELAQFSSWYELFPRSHGPAGRHGTFRDVVDVLPYVASMGFDVLYLPPVHPIGLQFRKGPNNSLSAKADDPGSPWAIGSAAGGHKALHPELGSVEDFVHLVAEARKLGLSVALDIAFQASPDHPYVKDHPEWFLHRADGTIQYAENPPKKYQDVYPFDLAGPAWAPLWDELVSVFFTWIERGVVVFRVDNPHTKPLAFWEYCIKTIKSKHPEVIFLAEAFTRPKLMYALAKLGFSQSYTYFTWRTDAQEMQEYLTELTQSPVKDFFRPNFWPNTPDILPKHLQEGGRAMFLSRLVLAGTLTANWGIYGPAFELMEHEARPGSEEYIDNEKFQLRSWDLTAPHSLSPVITQLNQIRRENRALQHNEHLVFHPSDNPALLAYSKLDTTTDNLILTVVNMQTAYVHSGWLELRLQAWGFSTDAVLEARDLLSGDVHHWEGGRVYVRLDPEVMPAHIFQIRRLG